MKYNVLIGACIGLALVPLAAQKIATETPNPNRVMHLKTALNHLTVIELNEPVLEVAVASPAFKVEWRENKVFIQPVEPEARTNLFIWTSTQRLSYELEPPGSVPEMDFAIDHLPLHPKPETVVSSGTRQPPPMTVSDFLLKAQPVRMMTNPHATKPVEAWISDLYEKDGQLLVRYTVFNHDTEPYAVNTPQVFQLDGVHSAKSLYTLRNCQLGENQISKLTIRHRVPVTVLNQELHGDTLNPGEQATGIISLEISSRPEPTVLSFQFLAGNASHGQFRRVQEITAYLVR